MNIFLTLFVVPYTHLCLPYITNTSHTTLFIIYEKIAHKIFLIP